MRRIPFWGRVAVPQLRTTAQALARPGAYAGDTRGRPARVAVYRYPEVPADGPVSSRLDGPEQVFRVRVTGRVANFGVVITQRGAGSRVEPRVVADGNENRLTGYPALPVNLNPYVDEFGGPTLVAGAIHPKPGTYHVVFDSPSPAGAGTFRFRFWINDVTPPAATIVSRSVRVGSAVRIRVRDAGAGVDPRSLEATVDGRPTRVSLRNGIVAVSTAGLAVGQHRLRVELADYQETRNMENVARILPNSRVVSARVTVVRRLALRPRLFDRRKRVEIPLDALDEVVVVRLHDTQLRLAALALTTTPCVGPDDFGHPRPFRSDDHDDAEGEQDDPRPAHLADTSSAGSTRHVPPRRGDGRRSPPGDRSRGPSPA